MAENTLLSKLEGLQHKFDEISTLITDPAVIADMKRFVKLNKEYRDLEKVLNAKKKYETTLAHLAEAKYILANEQDAEMREMAKAELDELEPQIAPMEEEIKLLLIPADPEDGKNVVMETKLRYLRATYIECTSNTAKTKDGKLLYPVSQKALRVDSRKSSSL